MVQMTSIMILQISLVVNYTNFIPYCDSHKIVYNFSFMEDTLYLVFGTEGQGSVILLTYSEIV